MSEHKYNLTVNFQGLTDAQVIALADFFDAWDSNIIFGRSRYMAFYVDGDGNFRPKIEMSHSSMEDMGLVEENGRTNELFRDLKRLATKENRPVPVDGRNAFDFDPIAWEIQKLREKKLKNTQ